MGTSYLGELSIVLHDLILGLTLLTWCLNVPKRREAYKFYFTTYMLVHRPLPVKGISLSVVHFTVPITYVVLTSPEPVWTSLVLDWWQPVQQP